MSSRPKFTTEDMAELTYLLFNAPINISCGNKEISPMNGRWYAFSNNKTETTFETFHDAVCWLLNPMWEKANGHPYE